jgi:hypothetical protein
VLASRPRHLVAKMNKALDEVRAGEARRLAQGPYPCQAPDVANDSEPSCAQLLHLQKPAQERQCAGWHFLMWRMTTPVKDCGRAKASCARLRENDDHGLRIDVAAASPKGDAWSKCHIRSS